MAKEIRTTILSIILILSAAAGVILYGRGYRLDFKKKTLEPTGLLVATSSPDGAKVIIDGKLTSATNTTFSLSPGWYQVKLQKEGYLPWEKRLRVQGEIVAKTEALLFPATPSLKPLTTTGVSLAVFSPDGTKIAYVIAQNDKAGLWFLDLNERPFLGGGSRQLAGIIPDSLLFSPNGRQILAKTAKTAYLLEIDRLNEPLTEVTLAVPEIIKKWNNEEETIKNALLSILSPELLKVATSSMEIIKWSPDESKILYEATSSASLPKIIVPPLIGANSTTEEREIKNGVIYVYDLKEDKNFPIGEGKEIRPKIHWFPDSRHLILVNKEQIFIIEYDGTNKTTVYAGPFEKEFCFPWPNGSKIVILTTLNPTVLDKPNLYAIDLK